MERARFIRFMITGGAAAIVNLVSRWLLNFLISFASAVAVAYLVGMVTAYVLGRLFVFERSGRSVADEFWRFTAVNLFAAAQVWTISVGLGEYVFPASGFRWHPLDVAHLIGVAVPIFTSYLGHRHFSFARPTSRSDGRSAPERAGRST
ncbi:MAG: GtrA family protein [Steroidobacteraceae bacterium]